MGLDAARSRSRASRTKRSRGKAACILFCSSESAKAVAAKTSRSSEVFSYQYLAYVPLFIYIFLILDVCYNYISNISILAFLY